MQSIYSAELKAHLSVDDENKVRQIRHSEGFWQTQQNVPRLAAAEYINQLSEVLAVPKAQLNRLDKHVSYFEPREQGVEFQLAEEKHLFDSTTVSYAQTYMNVPVWRKGLSVTIKQNPSRVVGSQNTSEVGITAKMPDEAIIERFRRIFMFANAERQGFLAPPQPGDDKARATLNKVLAPFMESKPGKGSKKAKAPKDVPLKLLNGRFFIYPYDAKKRYAGNGEPAAPPRTKKKSAPTMEEEHPTVKLPRVSPKIKDGQAYLVAEIRFEQTTPESSHMVWLVLVELETGSILYVKSLTCGVNGLVFMYDPITTTGNLTLTSIQSNAVLNPHRTDVSLDAIDAPTNGTQSLLGTYVEIRDVEPPPVVSPTQPSGTDFDYDVRTNNFAAVNAYYHQTELFQTIEGLGFPRTTYFDGTGFPIPVDHRGMNEINAHWAPNGIGGTGHMCYGVADDTTPVPADTIGRAVDKWVHWHEMAGHGSLGDHVNDGNFPFAHSAGDGLAALQNDPVSALRGTPMRFRYAPFRPNLDRFFGGPTREVAGGWGWGGINDTNGYNSEQILAASHFQVYRSIGGDSDDVNMRWFASRMATYLILRGIGELTEAVNADTPLEWCEKLMKVDKENWTTEGLFGGAYNKVIRWAFEKRGLYQPPGAPVPVITPGAPPDIDVHINDGRNGDYDFQPVHWQNQSIWNRNSPDGLPGHQNAIEATTNYAYVKVRNRGTVKATNVNVKGFHTLPGAGLNWPNDFTPMNPAGGLSVAGINPNNTEEVVVGPFEWTPNVNAFGHDCVLMIVSAAQDPSNVDQFVAGESIAEWRLVPNDNNIGQRNVCIVPGGGGADALSAALDGAVIFVGNTFNRVVPMELRVDMPPVLANRGWKLQFPELANHRLQVNPGSRQQVKIELVKGDSFAGDDIRAAGDSRIKVYLYADGMLIGGMTYQIDPDLREPSGGNSGGGSEHENAAQLLLRSMNLAGSQKVKKVRVKNVAVDIEID